MSTAGIKKAPSGRRTGSEAAKNEQPQSNTDAAERQEHELFLAWRRAEGVATSEYCHDRKAAWAAANKAEQAYHEARANIPAIPAARNEATTTTAAPVDINRIKRLYAIQALGIEDLALDDTGSPCLFADTVPEGKAAILSGPGGAGKSTLALTLALSVLTGRTLISTFIPKDLVPPRYPRVVYLSAEDSKAVIEARLVAIGEAYGIPEDELRHAIKRLAFIQKTGPLVYKGEDGYEPSALLQQLGALCDHVVDGPGAEYWTTELVIVDPVRNRLGTIDENSNSQVGGFIDCLLDTLEGQTILLLHHSRKDGGGTRGAGAFIDASRAAFEMEPTDNGATLRHAKANYTAKVPDTRLAFENGVLLDVQINAAALAAAVAQWVRDNPDFELTIGGLRQNIGKATGAVVADLGTRFLGVDRADIVAAVRAAVNAGTLTEAEIKQRGGATKKVLRATK